MSQTGKNFFVKQQLLNWQTIYVNLKISQIKSKPIMLYLGFVSGYEAPSNGTSVRFKAALDFTHPFKNLHPSPDGLDYSLRSLTESHP